MDSIAVIIPCYNYGRFLACAIDSCLGQTRPPDEILVVDDGSTDETATVCARYPQVRYLQKKNGGPSSARNLGVVATQCKYILFLDADDQLNCTSLEVLSQAMRVLQGKAVAVFGRTQVTANVANSSSSGSYSFPEHHDIQPFCEYVENEPHDISLLTSDFVSRLLRSNVIQLGAALVARQSLMDVRFFDDELLSAEDQDLWLRIASRYRIGYLNQIVATYRKHGDNLTDAQHWVRNHRNIMRVQEKCMRSVWAGRTLRHAATRQYAATAAHVGTRCAESGDFRQAVELFAKSVRYSPFRWKNWARLLVYLFMASWKCLTTRG
jgi:glycosyltransferase involved in cell wall biosynthesis